MNDSTIAAYEVSDEQLEQFAQWTDGERLKWVWDTACFIRSLQTREERIAAYRASEGKNVKYYDTYGSGAFLKARPLACPLPFPKNTQQLSASHPLFMKPALFSLLALSLTPLAHAQLAVAPKPIIRLYSEGLAEGITLNPAGARCVVITSFDAAPMPPRKPGDSLHAGGFYGSALPAPQSVDSFCYDDARRLVRFRSFARGKQGMALAGNYDANFVSTDSGLLQTISYADMPGTTVTTLSNNDEIIWSHTFGRGMLAVQEQHARFGGRREVSEKSFLLPWHRKRIEEPLPGGGWHMSTFVPRGPDTSIAAIQVADYDARHQPMLSYTLTPHPGGKSAGRVQYDTSDYVEYSYDKSGRLTAIGNMLRLEYGSKGTLPEVIVDSAAAGKPPAYWRVRYKPDGDRPTEILLYERKPAPKAVKASAYYFELHKKFEIAYLP